MKIIIKNMMAIKEATFDINEVGVHLFVGENSNGKSILGAVLSNIVLGRISNDDIRESIINDDAQSGSILLVRDNVALHVTVHRELSRTIYVYADCSPTGEILSKTVRSFREGGTKELLSKFGFVFYDDLCLQITETYGLLPFINTSLKLNGEMVKDHVTDTVAKRFIDNYKNITYGALTAKNRELRNEYKSLQQKLERIVVYDTDLYSEWLSKLRYYYDILADLVSFEYKPLELIPTVTFIDVEPFVVSDLSDLLSISGIETFYFKVNSNPLYEYVKVLHGVCPTCGKPLLERGVTVEHNHT